jgi:hypothetical protein
MSDAVVRVTCSDCGRAYDPARATQHKRSRAHRITEVDTRPLVLVGVFDDRDAAIDELVKLRGLGREATVGRMYDVDEHGARHLRGFSLVEAVAS